MLCVISITGWSTGYSDSTSIHKSTIFSTTHRPSYGNEDFCRVIFELFLRIVHTDNNSVEKMESKMSSNTMIIRIDSYFLLAVLESLDKELAKALRPIVEKDPTNPETIRSMKYTIYRKLPSFKVDKYLSKCSAQQ
jgi:hypothetical protein